MRALSVISRVRRSAGSPVRDNTSSTVLTIRASVDLASGQVHLHRSAPATAACVPDQRLSCSHACSSTQAPIGMIKPLSSATGMNRSAVTNPCWGWRHRMSASTPTAPEPSSSTTGW